MTAAYRLKGVGWFGGCVAVVLGFYLVSLQVAAERKKLETVNGQIRAAERDIRALETEFDTRANLAQLERWNGDTLSLSAPTAGQFVTSEAALASLDVNQIGQNGVQTAQLLVPSMPAAVPSAGDAAAPRVMTAAVQTAAVTTPQMTTPQMTGALRPAVIRAAVRASASAEAAIVRSVASERMAAVAKVRPQAVAMLDRKLLSDTTLGDILSGARAEAGRRH